MRNTNEFNKETPEQTAQRLCASFGHDWESIKPISKQLLVNFFTDADAGTGFVTGEQDILSYLDYTIARNRLLTGTPKDRFIYNLASSAALTLGIEAGICLPLIRLIDKLDKT